MFPILLLASLSAGLTETLRLRARERELAVFGDALAMLKSAAAYTAEDLRGLLRLCGENAFLGTVRLDGPLPETWRAASKAFFTFSRDRVLSETFLEGYGKSDLEGQIAYITLFEDRAAAALEEARLAAREKGKLYSALGLFLGSAAALIML